MKSLMKISLSLLVLSSLFAASAWAADPSAVIKANGSDGPVSITTNDNLSLTVALDPGSLAGDDADWWMLLVGPSGVFYDNLPVGWLPGVSTTYQGPLFDLPTSELMNMSDLASGSYTFYFGVDMNMNGEVDGDRIYYGSVVVNVQSANRFTIPDTGQTGDYTATFGEDSDYTINPPSYTDNGDGTVTDNVTGLMWQQSPDTDGDGDIDADDKLTYDAALAGADALDLAGRTDWRLPTIKELYSLIDFDGIDPSGYNGSDTSGLIPFIDAAYFDFDYGDVSAGERIIDAQYASANLYVSTSGNGGGRTMFGVNFADGRIKGYGPSPHGSDKTFYVIYVRGDDAYGQNDFVDNGDGSITDNASGLMWSRDDNGAGLDWEEALAWVASKNAENYLGYSNWRLPNAKELQSIVDYNRSPDATGSAAIDPLFNATTITNEAGQADYPCYWSGTTHANWGPNAGANAAYVAFGRAMGYMGGWVDVHGAGAQRSDPKSGDAADWPTGHGPQGDAIRIDNYVRLVR